MPKENPVVNSVRQMKIRCAKYKFAERSRNFLMQLPMQLIFGEFWDLDKLQTSTKGNIHFNIPFCVKGHPKDAKKCNRAKKYQKWFDRAALWRVYVYLISSTSMPKEKSSSEFRSPDKNPLRKIQILRERSHIFLMQLFMQLIFSDL